MPNGEAAGRFAVVIVCSAEVALFIVLMGLVDTQLRNVGATILLLALAPALVSFVSCQLIKSCFGVSVRHDEVWAHGHCYPESPLRWLARLVYVTARVRPAAYALVGAMSAIKVAQIAMQWWARRTMMNQV